MSSALQSVTGIFEASGNFSCSNQGDLVYSNGSKFYPQSTTCQVNAIWKGQTDLECVLVQLLGTNKYTLGSLNQGTSNFSCSISGNNSALTNSNLTLQVNNQAQLPNFQIQPIDHGKKVVCLLSWQSTKTEIRSETKTLIVNFPTQIRNISVNRDTSKGKHLVQSNQTISLYCSTSANPPATCQWKIPEKNISSNLSLNTTDPKNCNVTVVISKSGFVFCFANNNIGPVANKSVEFVSVPVERVPQIKINSSLVDSSNSIYYNKTQSIRLMCSVDNSQDLNTTYKWEKNGTLMGPFMTLDLDNLMPNNSGNYTCKTDDMFGSYVSEIRIEVQYPPDLQNESIKCSVNITCTITVLANPNVSYASISQSGGIIKEYTTGPKFQFTPNTTGNYTMFANNSIGELYFSFEVGSALFETPAGNQALIIGASVAGGLLIVVVVVLVIVLYRRKKNHKDEKEVRENPFMEVLKILGVMGLLILKPTKRKRRLKR
uniref:Mucin-5AC-like n=1 Tax=Phallusia mammillata TaxID=59560 RepID=A0A6F9DM19_9ASCI|nr:mucin-5AC-like [Phallusia mammillata]